MLVTCFIYARLDYCNAAFTCLLHHDLDRLQSVQNAAVKLIAVARNTTTPHHYSINVTGYQFISESFSSCASRCTRSSTSRRSAVCKTTLYRWPHRRRQCGYCRLTTVASSFQDRGLLLAIVFSPLLDLETGTVYLYQFDLLRLLPNFGLI